MDAAHAVPSPKTPTAPRAEPRWPKLDHCVDSNGKPGHIRGVDVFRVRDRKVSEKLSYVKGYGKRLNGPSRKDRRERISRSRRGHGRAEPGTPVA